MVKIQRNVNYAGYNDQYKGAQLILGTTDSDIDSMVATYTGHHEIDYQKPKILAVLASAPYFKDVAAYDGVICSTTAGHHTERATVIPPAIPVHIPATWALS